MGKGISEFQIRGRLRKGGSIKSVFVVEIELDDCLEYLPYFRTSWIPSFSPMRTHRAKTNRSYRDPRRLYQLIREFGYKGPIITFPAKSPELGRLVVDFLSDGSPVELALSELERALQS